MALSVRVGRFYNNKTQRAEAEEEEEEEEKMVQK